MLVYVPFGRTRLLGRVAGLDVPAWAAVFGARTWVQLFLKSVASHPDVRPFSPATSRASNMLDILGGGIRRLPDEATRTRTTALVGSWPQVEPRRW